MAWNRNNDPHSSEELMIAEYYRRVEESENLRASLEEERIAHQQTREELYEMLDEADVARKELEQNLQEVKDQADGVIDLHTPTRAYYYDVCATYKIKGWAENHPAEGYSKQHEKYKQVMALKELLDKEDESLWQFAIDNVAQYSDQFIKVKMHEFPHVLQVPWLPKPKKMLYDPSYSDSSLYAYNTKIQEARWIVAEDLKKIKPVAIKKLRELIDSVIVELRNEMAEED